MAVLLSYLSTQTILKVINLLLMEKSVIVSGREPGVVTGVSSFKIVNYTLINYF